VIRNIQRSYTSLIIWWSSKYRLYMR